MEDNRLLINLPKELKVKQSNLNNKLMHKKVPSNRKVNNILNKSNKRINKKRKLKQIKAHKNNKALKNPVIRLLKKK